MARTGLRLMPTSPSPPLRFRMVSFPQYGFKASLSANACPRGGRVKRTPHIPRQAFGLHPPSRTPRLRDPVLLRCLAPQGHPEGPASRDAPLPPGVLGSGPSSAVSVHPRVVRPHPPVSQAPRDFTGSRRIRGAFAVRERRGAPRDLPSFPWRAVRPCRRPYPGGSAALSPVVHGQRYQAPSNYERVATHSPVSASNPRRGSLSRLHRSRHATARAFARPSWLATTRRAAPPAEVPCHSRFWHWPSPASAGSQARWATGKSPIIGTSPRLVTTGSGVAP